MFDQIDGWKRQGVVRPQNPRTTPTTFLCDPHRSGLGFFSLRWRGHFDDGGRDADRDGLVDACPEPGQYHAPQSDGAHQSRCDPPDTRDEPNASGYESYDQCP